MSRCSISPVVIVLVCAALSARANAIEFDDMTANVVDQLADSEYHFYAISTDFNDTDCYAPFILSHNDPTTPGLWINHCCGSNSFNEKISLHRGSGIYIPTLTPANSMLLVYTDGSMIHKWIPNSDYPKSLAQPRKQKRK